MTAAAAPPRTSWRSPLYHQLRAVTRATSAPQPKSPTSASALWPALLLALVGLFACGALVARVTARNWWYSGLRQLVLGGAAAAVTYGLGALLGAAV